jgi:tRNA C32,U32 (ribose-2'-O)-methylase TrmJ
MKTMGLKNLILVNPKEFPSKEAFMLSGNAQDVIEQATVVNTLEEAIKEEVVTEEPVVEEAQSEETPVEESPNQEDPSEDK